MKLNKEDLGQVIGGIDMNKFAGAVCAPNTAQADGSTDTVAWPDPNGFPPVIIYQF